MTRRVRLLHIITRLDRGGSAENTLLSAAGADPGRYEVALAVGPTAGLRSATEAEARRRGVRFVDVPDLVRAPDPRRDLRAYGQLRRLVAEGWDVVHTHTSKAGILGRLAARRAGVRAIVHTPHGHVFYGYHAALVTALFVRLERRAARWCQRLVALTVADRDDHLRFGVGRPDQWVVVHSGVDLRPLDAATPAMGRALRAELGIPAEAVVVGTLGRLTAVKGQAALLRAFAALASARAQALRLLLVGDGEEEPALRTLAGGLGIADRVVFAGWRAEVGPALRAMDLFALPSLNEGMGKALVEAMYAGLPVVATAVGGVPEVVTDGSQGLLVPPGDVAALAAALGRLLDDDDLRQRLGAAARQRAGAYGHEAMVARLDTLYQELLAAPSLGSQTHGDGEEEEWDGQGVG